ncbi:MAG TPA: 16S rRNA (uracil(1498)-N(3))-methyltransferase, partial [Cobetia sp.]|nr:16S rRNA (uracil(1498)-N(3))-methyltransferase [Cobetia sp.]
IGPEGGFTQEEVAEAAAAGCEVLGLGPRILRTETAPVVALTLLQQRFGDLPR